MKLNKYFENDCIISEINPFDHLLPAICLTACIFNCFLLENKAQQSGLPQNPED